MRAGHGHPASPLCPEALPLSFLPPTKTLGIVWGGKNPPHNTFIIFWGKVLAAFPLNPVSMRQPNLRAGTSPGLATGALSAPAPGSARHPLGAAAATRQRYWVLQGGWRGNSSLGGGRGGHSTSSAAVSLLGEVLFLSTCFCGSLGTQCWRGGGTGDTGNCWGGGGSMGCFPAQLQQPCALPTPLIGVP